MAIDYWHKLEEHQTYHIYNRAAVDNLNIFKEDADYIEFLKKFEKLLGPYLDTFAYCLMPNHFHFLSKVKPIEEVEKFVCLEKTKSAIKLLANEITLNDFLVDQMRRLFSSVSIRHNNKYVRRGPLFAEKFKRIAVNREVKLNYLLCYIHHNPIHHKFRKNYADWKYSSYNIYLSNDKTISGKEEILDWIGGLDRFIQAHEDFRIIKNDYLNFE